MESGIKNKASFKSNVYLIITLVIISANIFFMIFGGKLAIKNQNIISDADCFNLSQIDFDNGEHAYLSGEWEFYHNSLLVTDNIDSKSISAFIDVPSSWSGITGSSKYYSSGGYGTYKCTVSGINAAEELTVYIPNIACAYRVYVDDMLVSSSGSISKIQNNVWTSSAHESTPFVINDLAEHEITIEIASQYYSGLYMQPLIANYDDDYQYVNIMTALRFLLIGIVAFCGILFIIFRKLVNKALYSVWLPILSFILLFRMLISTEGYAVTQPLFLDLSYEQMNIFIIASTFIIKLASLTYFISCLNIKAKENTLVLFSFVSLILAVSVSILPDSVFDVYYFIILQMCSSILDLYIINKLCIKIAEKTPHSLLYLMTYMFVVVGVTIDSFYTNGLIEFRCSSYMPVCFFAFVVLTSIIHAVRIRKMYSYALQTQRLKNELDKANMSLMLSQIQPHFLYNALNTIKSLIKRDPQRAEKAVIDFSLYLRGNMDSLSKTDPIPFSEELNHIKYYCSIEQLRFQDKLEIFYDIGPDSFYVPTLSVQPIVENAIKHGVTKKPEGGSVTIATREDRDNYYIIVEDDGVGFDVESIWQQVDSDRSHVGIKNTTDRLKKIMGAAVSVKSDLGKGTEIKVALPKAKNVKTIQESLDLADNKNIFKEMEI